VLPAPVGTLAYPSGHRVPHASYHQPQANLAAQGSSPVPCAPVGTATWSPGTTKWPGLQDDGPVTSRLQLAALFHPPSRTVQPEPRRGVRLPASRTSELAFAPVHMGSIAGAGQRHGDAPAADDLDARWPNVYTYWCMGWVGLAQRCCGLRGGGEPMAELNRAGEGRQARG
jgi:hypothetical protein